MASCLWWKGLEPTGQWVGKEQVNMQYLVTGEFIDPGPLLPPDQLAGMLRQLVLPSHEGGLQRRVGRHASGTTLLGGNKV